MSTTEARDALIAALRDVIRSAPEDKRKALARAFHDFCGRGPECLTRQLRPNLILTAILGAIEEEADVRAAP